MKKLIAVVAVATLVDGQRHTFLPGEEVTGLNAVDEAELKRMGSIEDQGENRAQAREEAQALADAERDFADMRRAVQATQAAVEAAPAAQAPAAAPPAPQGKRR